MKKMFSQLYLINENSHSVKIDEDLECSIYLKLLSLL